MGAELTVLPGLCDYRLSIVQPSEGLLQLAQTHSDNILQEIKIKGTQKEYIIKISSLLLQHLLSTPASSQILINTPCKTMLLACHRQDTLDQFLFQTMASKCECRPFQPSQIISRIDKPGSMVDIKSAFSEPCFRDCEVLPDRYLLIENQQNLVISKVDKNEKIKLAESPLSQKIVLSLLRNTIQRSFPGEMKSTFQGILNQIMEEGDCAKADLLVGDLFGLNNCQHIGLPPKLIASSLAKFAKSQVECSVWDQAQSLLVAFLLNLGVLVREQVMLTGVRTVVMEAGEVCRVELLNVTLLAPHAELFVLRPRPFD